MKYCTKCDAHLPDEAVVCAKCGYPVNPMYTYFNESRKPASKVSKLRIAALVLMSITTAGVALFAAMLWLLTLIGTLLGGGGSEGFFAMLMFDFFFSAPLAWMLPMLVVYCKRLKLRAPIGMGFKICTLIFFNIIAGVLLLCDSAEEPNIYVA